MQTETGSTRDPGTTFFDHLLPQSRMQLNMALAVHGTEGMEGWVMVYIPPNKKAPCEVIFAGGGWDLTIHPTTFNARTKKRAS